MPEFNFVSAFGVRPRARGLRDDAEATTRVGAFAGDGLFSDGGRGTDLGGGSGVGTGARSFSPNFDFDFDFSSDLGSSTSQDSVTLLFFVVFMTSSPSPPSPPARTPEGVGIRPETSELGKESTCFRFLNRSWGGNGVKTGNPTGITAGGKGDDKSRGGGADESGGGGADDIQNVAEIRLRFGRFDRFDETGSRVEIIPVKIRRSRLIVRCFGVHCLQLSSRHSSDHRSETDSALTELAELHTYESTSL
ncbi:hypothetical protein PQX77_009611 [Marasmius sp. AFHP31]|nr:hypothetical protein PQX77_009611 [Marasmius sp. AFHP31]